MKIKFTEQALKKLSVPEGSRDHQWFDADTPGFGIRKFSSGRMVYFVKYRVGSKQKKVTIGRYQPGNIGQMRRKAEEVLIDARRASRETPRALNLSLGDVVDRYLNARETEVDPIWFLEITRFLKQYWADLHHQPIRELERGELVRKLDTVAKERGARTADHTQVALSTLFSWAIDRGYADANPLTRLKRRTKANNRTRVLSLQELVAIWQAAGDDDFGEIDKLLSLTLQRKTEISDLQWDEIDLSGDPQIKLPGERTKNGLAHDIPLTGQAETILRTRKRKFGRQYVFGDGQRGFQGWSKAKRRVEVAACRVRAPELLAEVRGNEATDDSLHAIIPHWTLHDLRRTGATMMNEFGLAEPYIIEAVLNHISGASKGGVAGVYNRARYDAQKRVALERWGTFVMTAVEAFKKAGFEAVREFEHREKQRLRGAL